MNKLNEEERNKLIFEDMPVRKALANMAVPIIIAQIIILIYNIADVFFIGRTNNPYMLAGASLILPVYNFSYIFSSISGTGGGTLVSRLLGEGKINNARKVSTFSILFALVSSFLFALLMHVFMSPILRALGASDDTFRYAKQYATCVIVLGGIPTILSMTMGNIIRSSGNSKAAGFGGSLGGIINIFLDPLFMFVFLPKGYEVVGAGIATALSNFIVCIYFIIVIKKSKSEIITFSVREGMPEKREIRSFFGVGIPAATQSMLFDLAYILIDRLMASYSDTALAAIGVVLKAERLPLNVGVGLCLGMVPLVAYNYSSGNYKRMHDIVHCARNAGIVIGIVSITLYEIFAPYIMKFFIADEATVRLGTGFLRARALATLFMFLSFFHMHYFQGVGRGKTALFLTVTRWVVLNYSFLFLFNWLFGMNGVVWTQFASDFCMATISLIVYYRFDRKLFAVSGKQLEDPA